MPDLTLHPHETARLRVLRPGEELLAVRPMEPQPHLLKGAAGRPMWRRGELYWRGDRSELLVWYSPHRPGDVVTVGHRWESVPGGVQVAVPRYRLTLARVEARRARELTDEEWQAAGFADPCDVAALWWWEQTEGRSGHEFAWDNAWAWCEWWQLAAAEAKGGRMQDNYGRPFHPCPQWAADEITRLRERVAELEAEIERLRAIVDRLPKTADGVPVTPGMIVFANIGGDIAAVHVAMDSDGRIVADLGDGIGTGVSDCYSTREAAQAAGGTDAEPV